MMNLDVGNPSGEKQTVVAVGEQFASFGRPLVATFRVAIFLANRGMWLFIFVGFFNYYFYRKANKNIFNLKLVWGVLLIKLSNSLAA